MIVGSSSPRWAVTIGACYVDKDTRRGLFLGLVRRRVGREQFDCRLVLVPMGGRNSGLLRRQRYAAAFTQGLHFAGSSRPQRVLTILVPHPKGGAEQKMPRGKGSIERELVRS